MYLHQKENTGSVPVFSVDIWDKGFYTGATAIMKKNLLETFSKNKVNIDLEELVALPYDVFTDRLNNYVLDMLKNKFVFRAEDGMYTDEEEKIVALERLFSDTDVYYCMLRSKRFAFDIKDMPVFDGADGYAELKNLSPEDFQSCGDFVVDLMYNGKFLNMGLKVIDTSYDFIMRNGNRYKALAVGLLYSNGNAVGNLLDFYVIPELYPRLYINTAMFNTERCNRCPMRSYMVDDGIKLSIGNGEMSSICRLNRRKMNECVCNSLLIPNIETGIGKDISFSMHTFTNLIYHIVDTYTHRGSVVRSNGKHRNLQKKASVSIPRNREGKERLLTLNEYVNIERRERKEWQGGHHSSPVEHERRPHIRHYYNEDGTVRKTIEVRGSIVNQGKSDKGVYKISAGRASN